MSIDLLYHIEFDKCMDEVYAIIPKEAKTKGFAPGFAYADLEADLKAITG